MYADANDVAARYEGTIPDERTDWVELRVTDVENELVGLVPSLADPTTVDEARAGRVQRLVCDKVLALYRNPDGALTVSDTLGPMTQSRTLPGSRVSAGSWVSFTEDELRSVRLKRSSRYGSVTVKPWNYRGWTA